MEPPAVLPYTVTVDQQGKKCTDAEEDLFTRATGATVEECTEAAFENGAEYFHHAAADLSTGAKAVCNVCMLDAAGAPMGGYQPKSGYTVRQITPNFPATLRSWDKKTCAEKCPAHQYMKNGACENRPACQNKLHYREKTEGACVSCPAGRQPDAAQAGCMNSPVFGSTSQGNKKICEVTDLVKLDG